MEKRKKISVIIPVYNGQSYIRNAIETALNQSIKVDEVVVVDDCSTDNTPLIVKKIKDPRIIYIRNSKNLERAHSRNIGAKIAKGEYLFFLDYDDLWKEDYIEHSIKHLELGFDIVYSIPRDFINSEGKLIRVSKKPIPKDIPEAIFGALIGYPSATALRKASFSQDIYRAEYVSREDWEFFIRSYIEGKSIKVLDNRKVYIREHSFRTSGNPKFIFATLKVYADYKERVPSKYASCFLFHTALVCLKFGNLPYGWFLLLKSIRQKPSLLANPRNIINEIKWGIRIDRWFKFKSLKPPD